MERTITLCVTLIFSSALWAQEKASLELRGDPAATWQPREAFVHPRFGHSDPKSKDPASKAPFHCSECEKSGLMDAKTVTPRVPTEILRQPRSAIEAWGSKEHKLAAIVLSMDRAVVISYLGPMESKLASKAELEAVAQQLKSKVGSRLSPHERAHLYAMRYLEAEHRWCDLLSVKPERIGNTDLVRLARSEYFLFENLEPYREFGRHFFGMFGSSMSWWWHEPSLSLTGSLNGTDVKDDALAARFAYLTTHILCYQHNGFLFRIPSFLPAGLSHWAERSHSKRVDSFMVMGVPTQSKSEWSWAPSDWDADLSNSVKAGKSKPFVTLGLIDKDDQLTPPFRGQAWSMIKYLAGVDRAQLGTFLSTALHKRQNESAVEALARAAEVAYGKTLPELEAGWKEWATKGRYLKR